MLQWRAALLTAPFRFEIVLPGDARYWRSQNLRQEIMEAGQVVALSIRQWVYDVVGFKAAKEADTGLQLGAAQVAKYYEEHMHYAGQAEHIRKICVASAITSHNPVLGQATANK